MKQILEVSLYNVPEAAALLEVTSQTVRKYVKEGRL
jgi:predicted site-specific integrase-resolvase